MSWRGLAVLALLAPAAARAAGDPASPPQQVQVLGTRSADLVGVADSATEGTASARQLATRPLLRAAEVLEAMPGMTVTQHSGDGKANQYFLRGFNLDHGSDFATFVAGMPVNNVSHAHGQGYTDLNFLIPELVRTVRYRKGSYSAEDGDLAVAGVARIEYVNELPAPFVEARLGSFGHRRWLGAGSRALEGGLQLLAAAELGATDGPWQQPERLRKANALLRLSSGSGFNLTAMAYRSHWTATEQVPQRAVQDGEIGRYGTLAPSDGGVTYRQSLSAAWTGDHLRASAHALRYGLNLFSTPSGLQEPQHEQEDRRSSFGASLQHPRSLGPDWRDSEALFGLQWRHDRIPRLGLHATVERVRTGTVRSDRVSEDAAGLFAELRTAWQPWLRSTLGLRWDRIEARVAATGGDFNAGNGGAARAQQLSPKLALALGPFAGTEFYANAGTGFHSNDARGATSTRNPADGSASAPVPLLAQARSSELGFRATQGGWNSALSLWQTRLASELVFVGDAGVTEPRGASRRHGIEWWNDWAAGPGLTLDGDLALSQARFEQAVNGGTRVPNAIPLSASLGLAAEPPGPWRAGLRWRYIGAYPLEETGTQKSRPTSTVNLLLGWRPQPRWQWSAELLNLFDSRANDIEYWGSACTRSEGAACNGGQGIDGRLVHPLEPRTLRLSLRASL